MEKSKSTPGPWESTLQDNIYPGHTIYEITGPNGVVICRTVNGTSATAGQTDMFNARLISAAPDLLKACQEYLEGVHNSDEKQIGDAYWSMRWAIDRVNGVKNNRIKGA